MISVLILGLHGILGGTETYINSLIRAFDKTEIVCDFLIVGKEKTPYEDAINEFYGDGRNHFFYCPNLKNEYIHGKRWLKEFYDSHRYDLIYLNATSAANAIYCQYAIGHQKIPMVTHSHFSDGPWINHMLYRAYTKKHTVAKLACAKPAAQWMFGKDINDVLYIANGIDTNRFAYNHEARAKIRAEYGITDDTVLLGHVGRFSVEKNHKFFVELAKALPSKYVFMCIGEGACKEEFNKLVHENGLSKRFIVLPVRKDVEQFYCAMDLFVMPSLYEGLPIVTVEAQCSGLPIVFSNTISREADLSGHCYFESIEDVSKWKDRILSMNMERYDGVTCVNEAGFSNIVSAANVRKVFLDAIKIGNSKCSSNDL